jgi:Uncharacterized protein (competence- and mitomycin-induced)
MARNVKLLFNADIGISTSGVAGPEPDDGVEVGRTFFGISYKEDIAYEYKFSGSRHAIKEKGSYYALFLLLKNLCFVQ